MSSNGFLLQTAQDNAAQESVWDTYHTSGSPRVSDARVSLTHNQSISTIYDSTTVGRNLVKLTNPNIVCYLKIIENNTVETRTAAEMLSDIGACGTNDPRLSDARTPTDHSQTVSTISDASTVGRNIVKLLNPSATTFLRINPNNSVDALSADDFRTAIGVGMQVRWRLRRCM